MIIDVNSDYDIIKWKRNSEEWKIAPLEELIDCFDKYTWIPVSERLPEKEGEVLVTTSWCNVCMAWCDNGKWRAEYINGYDDDEILAWMPLPEPYRGDADE